MRFQTRWSSPSLASARRRRERCSKVEFLVEMGCFPSFHSCIPSPCFSSAQFASLSQSYTSLSPSAFSSKCRSIKSVKCLCYEKPRDKIYISLLCTQARETVQLTSPKVKAQAKHTTVPATLRVSRRGAFGIHNIYPFV